MASATMIRNLAPDLGNISYADLTHLPPASEEEYQFLHVCLSSGHLDEQVRDRLVEAYLPLLIRVAAHRCPPTYTHLFPDLVGEIALILVDITRQEKNLLMGIQEFRAYVFGCVDHAIARTIAASRLIRIPDRFLQNAKRDGTERVLYRLQPQSLDAEAQRRAFDGGIYEPITTPILPTTQAPPRDPILRAQIAAWLSYMPARAQQVLTLRYGLSDDDERALSQAEVAHELHLPRHIVRATELTALRRLKALIEGRATPVEQGGRRWIAITQQERHKERRTPSQIDPMAHVAQVHAELEARGERTYISARQLAKAAHVGGKLAHKYLRTQAAGQALPYERHIDPMAHVAQVYAELEARGEHITSYKQLAKAAHVGSRVAMQFMRMRKGTEKCDQQKLHQELHERFMQAYAELEAKGEHITVRRIVEAADLNEATVRKYLKAQRKGMTEQQGQTT